MSFIVIVFLSLNYQYSNTIIIDVVDNPVVSGDMTRISDIIATNKSLRMSLSCTRVLHDVHQNLCCFFEEIRNLRRVLSASLEYSIV